MTSLPSSQNRLAEIQSLLTCLVEIESPSTDKAAIDRLGEFIAGQLTRLGASLTIDRQDSAGNNIIGTWNQGSGEGGILLLCHMDTVYEVGTLAQRPLLIEDGKFFAPGALDMKASIAIVLSTLAVMIENGTLPNRPITALFTSDEETGSHASLPLIQAYAQRASLVLCMEPSLPDSSLKTARKGTGDIEIVTEGRAAHAGVDHEKGVNAIEELAHHILSAQKLTDYTRGTTVNVGIVSGGTRTNVVPDQAQAQVDFRAMTSSEVERLRLWADNLKPVLEGTRVTARVSQNRPPMPRDALMIQTFQKVQEIARRLSLALTEGSTGGGSDANFVAPLGVPVLDGLGGTGDGAHSEREYVLLASLPERAALLSAILRDW